MERKEVTEAELANHSTAEDCWVCMHDLVLELTKEFLDEHPGGADVILPYAGKDCTQDFEDIAHSDQSREWANKLVVGYMSGSAEESQTKNMPTKAEAGTGGSAGVLPLIIMVFVVLGVFIAMQMNRSEGKPEL